MSTLSGIQVRSPLPSVQLLLFSQCLQASSSAPLLGQFYQAFIGCFSHHLLVRRLLTLPPPPPPGRVQVLQPDLQVVADTVETRLEVGTRACAGGYIGCVRVLESGEAQTEVVV